MITNDHVFPILGLSMFGLVSFYLRRVPGMFLRFVKHLFIVEVHLETRLTNDGYLWAFIEWYTNHHEIKGRNYVLDSKTTIRGVSDPFLSMGESFQWFKLDGSLMGFSYKSELSGEGRESMRSEKCTIYCARSAKHKLQTLFDSFKKITGSSTAVYLRAGKIGSAGNVVWRYHNHRKIRDLESSSLSADVKERVIGLLNKFEGNEKWYKDRFLPFKKTILLTGEPGTGKTTLVSSIAARTGRPVCVIDFGASEVKRDVATYFQALPKHSIAILEDIDASGFSVGSRENEGQSELQRSTDENALSSLLNVLEGVVPLDDVIVVMTTNYPERLDPALIRPGRVDEIIEIGPLDNSAIRTYIGLMYPEACLSDHEQFAPIKSCDLQQIFFNHQNDFEGFYRELKSLGVGEGT